MNCDLVETCLKELKFTSREPVEVDPILQERMMQEQSRLQSGRPSRRVIIAAMLATLILGSTAFVAAGGVTAAKHWFGILEWVTPDGEYLVEPIEGQGDGPAQQGLDGEDDDGVRRGMTVE